MRLDLENDLVRLFKWRCPACSCSFFRSLLLPFFQFTQLGGQPRAEASELELAKHHNL